MERRNLLVAGAAIAAAGVPALLAQTKSAAAATLKPNRTVFDFGAVGDGVTDDSAAFTAALQYAASTGSIILVPGNKYAIKRPIKHHITNVQGNPWGFQAQGATLLSSITTGENVISIGAANTVRYFQITGGLKIVGSGSDGNGLHLYCYSGGWYFYNCLIDNLYVERVGQNGLFFDGNVFETTISNSYFQDCGKNGALFAHHNGGVCSAITCIGCFFNQNGQYGMCATTLDGQWGGTTDVRVYGGYCRDNKSYGFYYNNGTSPGAAIDQVGFENNCKSLSPGDPNGAHVFAYVRMNMRNCTGYNQNGGATYLLRGWFSDLVSLQGCSQDAGGAMAATGKSRLLRLDGATGAHACIDCSFGGLDVVNPTCTWEATACKGPSPLGPLKLNKSFTNVA